MTHQLSPPRRRRIGFRRIVVSTVVTAIAWTLVAGAMPASAQAYDTTGFGRFGKNKVQYRKFDWQIYHSPHFDVHYYTAEEQLLQKVVSMAESAYDHLSRRFDYQIEESTPLIFYKTHSEFEQNNIFTGFVPEAVGAFATSVRHRMVLPVDLPDGELYGLILHELTHIFQYHIIFGGKLGRGLASQPPTWMMEGMASYYAADESTSDRMFLRDAVVNDLVPPISQAQGGGFFAYRFGHAAFDFMEEQWGPEGVIDFLYEFRSSLGGSVERALGRAFRVEAEDFDADFRRWLRNRYLPELVATGEPSYFGRRFYSRKNPAVQFFAPIVSPSGDLVAAIGNPAGELDVVLLDTRHRQPLKNLTKGWATEYQYLSAQHGSISRRAGRDLAFSPDGNHIAAFARREGNRSLLLINVIKGGVDRIIDVEVQQPFSVGFSPDGRQVAFAGSLAGQFDIFLLDLETEEVTNLTNDLRFDGGPVFSPDGKYVIYSSEAGTYEKLVRLEVANPDRRVQLIEGDWNDVDPVYSPDGGALFFTSDRNGFENIYSVDLTSGDVVQHTNAITGCFGPTVLERSDGSQSLVYAGYWKGRFDIYRSEFEDSLGVVDTISRDRLTDQGEAPLELEIFEPDIQVAIDDANREEYGRFKLFLEDGDVAVGVSSDNLFVSQSYISFTDQLGDRRLLIRLSSVASFSDFDISYTNLASRLQWSARLFDSREFFVGRSVVDGSITQRDNALTLTGADYSLIYPFSLNHRVEASVGYMLREYDFQSLIFDEQTGEYIPFITPREDDFPQIATRLVGDTTIFGPWGGISGRRWTVGGSYAPDFDEGGTLTASAFLDARQYIPVTRRSNFAFRVFGGASWGNFPNVFYFGGFNTMRGFDFRSLVGDRAFYTNLEFRFPLIDRMHFSFLHLDGIRGRLFLDVGGAWFDYAGQDFNFWNSEENKLEDGVSSYGWGLIVRWGFIELNWDFAKRWDFDQALSGFETSFWIGGQF